MDILEVLAKEAPKFHPVSGTEALRSSEAFFASGAKRTDACERGSYGLSVQCLRFIDGMMAPGQVSLETGGGVSTCFFAAKSSHHYCVNPDVSGNALVVEFLQRHGFPTASLTLVEDSSDTALAAMIREGVPSGVHLALIDGNHSYPYPMIDCHFADKLLKKGGILLVDDTHIPSVKAVVDYLVEDGAYCVRGSLGSLTCLVKRGQVTLGWKDQRINMAPAEAAARRRAAEAAETSAQPTEGRSALRITAVICTFRRPDVLAGAIESLLHQTLDPAAYEILVIDNNSRDATKHIIQRYVNRDPRVRYILHAEPGLSRARNRAVAEARGEIIAFIDDDAKASPQWLEALLAAYDADPEVWAAGGNVEPIWEAPRPPWLDDSMLQGLSLVNWGSKPRRLKWPERLIGTNCSFRRDILAKVGLFDPTLGRIEGQMLCREDTEIQQRIHDCNKIVQFSPEAVVCHRVPRERLEEKYFYKAAAGSGKSLAMVEYRRMGRWHVARQTLVLAAKVVRFSLRLLFRGRRVNRVGTRFGLCAWRAYVAQGCRLLLAGAPREAPPGLPGVSLPHDRRAAAKPAASGPPVAGPPAHRPPGRSRRLAARVAHMGVEILKWHLRWGGIAFVLASFLLALSLLLDPPLNVYAALGAAAVVYATVAYVFVRARADARDWAVSESRRARADLASRSAELRGWAGKELARQQKAHEADLARHAEAANARLAERERAVDARLAECHERLDAAVRPLAQALEQLRQGLLAESGRRGDAIAAEARARAEQAAALAKELRAALEDHRRQHGKTLEDKSGQLLQAIRAEQDERTRAFALRDRKPYQQYARRLSADDEKTFLEVWAPKLGVSVSARQLRYLQQRISCIEDQCRGRMAGATQDAILRMLVGLGAARETVDILEIGALFGVCTTPSHAAASA